MKTLQPLIVLFVSVMLGVVGATLRYDGQTTFAQSALDLQRQDAKLLGPRGHSLLLDCAAGWRQFVSSLIGYQGFEEYFQEITETNLCYRGDLEAVRAQVDKARRVVRSSFLRCETERLDEATKAYYKLEAELYFLHNMIEPSKTGNPENQGRALDRIRDPVKLQALASEMKRFFVIESGFLTEELLQEYIEEFEGKYRSRVIAYESCRSDYYSELADKWNELVEIFEAFGGSFDKRETAHEAARKTNDEDPSSRDGPFLKIEDDLDLNFKIARLKVEPEKSFEDLVQTVLRAPGAIEKPLGLSHEEAPVVVSTEQERVAEEISRAEIEARFDLLYAEMSDASAAEIDAKMNEWINAVTQSIPVLKEIESCAFEVEEKQCKNSKL